MMMRVGKWPRSRRVVSRGLSRRTVLPPTMTLSLAARCSNTRCLDAALLTHALWPVCVAILPSSVIAYFRVDIGTPRTSRCSSGYSGTRGGHGRPGVRLVRALGGDSADTAAAVGGHDDKSRGVGCLGHTVSGTQRPGGHNREVKASTRDRTAHVAGPNARHAGCEADAGHGTQHMYQPDGRRQGPAPRERQAGGRPTQLADDVSLAVCHTGGWTSRRRLTQRRREVTRHRRGPGTTFRPLGHAEKQDAAGGFSLWAMLLHGGVPGASIFRSRSREWAYD